MKGVLLAVFFFAPTILPAVEPDEVLADAALEMRARDISAGLRCPVCRNESIDESSADLARDIRVMVRERLSAGATDEAVRAAVVARYGEFVLLRPNFDGANLILWLTAPLMLLAGLGLGIATVRRRAATPQVPLTADEDARLRDLLGG